MFYQSESSSVIDESLRKSLIKAYKNGVLKVGHVENYTLLCPEPCPEKDKLFLLDTEIGRGGQGIVYFCQELISLRWYVAKAISNQVMASTENIERERYHLEVIKRLQGVVKTEDVTYLIMEYFPGVPLTEILYEIDALAPLNSPRRFKSKKNLPSIRKFELCLGAIAAVLKIHGFNVAHRDIKPDNLIVSENNFQNMSLVDLASAIHLSNTHDTSFKENVATKGYTPPEIYLPESERPPSSFKTDYFQLGLILAEILSKECEYAKIIREHLRKCQENNAFECDLPLEMIMESFHDVFHYQSSPPQSTQNAPNKEEARTSLAINITRLDLNRVTTFDQKIEKLKNLKHDIYDKLCKLCQQLCQLCVEDRPSQGDLKESYDEILKLYYQYAVLLKEVNSPKEKQGGISPGSIQPRRGSLTHTTAVKASLSLSPRKILSLFSTKKSIKAASPKNQNPSGPIQIATKTESTHVTKFDLESTSQLTFALEEIGQDIPPTINPQTFVNNVEVLSQNALSMDCPKTANYLNLAKITFQEEHSSQKHQESSPSVKRIKPR